MDDTSTDRPVTMHRARRQFARERKAGATGSFRAWARKTYVPATSAGKLARIVGGRAKRR